MFDGRVAEGRTPLCLSGSFSAVTRFLTAFLNAAARCIVVICLGARSGFNPSVPVAPCPFDIWGMLPASVALPSPASVEFDELDKLDELDEPDEPRESVDLASDVGSSEVSSVGLSNTSSNEDRSDEVRSDEETTAPTKLIH